MGWDSLQVRCSELATWVIFNDLMLMATLSGIEMTLDVSAVPHKKGGVQAAIDYIATQAQV